MISFSHPFYLWFVFLIPLYFLVFFMGSSYTKRRAVNFANFDSISRISGTEIFSKDYFSFYIHLTIIIVLILSLSGMQYEFYADTSAFTYVIAIDSSRSMGADDLKPNRLEAAKQSAKNFVNDLPIGVKVGVLSFSGQAIALQEPTTSKSLINLAIDSVIFGDLEGTNIYNAVLSAEQLFKFEKRKSIIILSDGQSNVGETPQIIDYALSRDIVLNTIAVGTPEGGVTDYEAISRADIDFLKSLSFNTQGSFFLITTQEDLDQSFEQLIEYSNKKITLELRPYLIIAAMIMLIISWTLYNFRLRTVP